MSDSQIVTLIKSIVAEFHASAHGGAVTPQPAASQTTGTTESGTVDSGDGTDGEGSVQDDGPRYDWRPPDLSPIQIQPFIPKEIGTPSGLYIVDQSVQLSADGTTLVIVTVGCDDVQGAAEYEFRISSD